LLYWRLSSPFPSESAAAVAAVAAVAVAVDPSPILFLIPLIPIKMSVLQARMVEDRNREILALCEKYALAPPRSLAAGACARTWRWLCFGCVAIFT